jgi:hypothetical protein
MQKRFAAERALEPARDAMEAEGNAGKRQEGLSAHDVNWLGLAYRLHPQYHGNLSCFVTVCSALAAESI